MKAEHEAEQQAASGAGVGALMSTPSTRKAMLIAMALMTFQNLSGVNADFLFLGKILATAFTVCTYYRQAPVTEGRAVCACV